MSCRSIFFLPLVVWLFTGCSGSEPALQGNTETVQQWGRFERIFTAATDTQPALEATFVDPEGGEHIVDGFWDGGRIWRVRFQPDRTGRWTYRTRSSPPVDGLDGQTGAFVVTTPEAENPFLRHGAVRVSDNGRYFAHADGTPFFWLGDTAWNGALRAQADHWGRYLHDRVDKGFTVIQFVTTQWRAAYVDAEGQVAYSTSGDAADDLTIHPGFFQRLDRRVDAVNEAGLLAAPVVLWALGDPDEVPVPGKLPAAQAIKLARYIVARYGAHHVAWFLAGDENFGGDREAFWKEVGRGVFGDREHAPVTLHPRGMQWKFEPFYNETWLDFLIYQSGHGDSPETFAWTHSGPPSRAWQQSPPRPIINSEPNYEDHIAYQSRTPHTAYSVRRAAYWSLLNAPTAGVSYGAHGIWSWEADAVVPLNHDRSGVARPWELAMLLPGSAQMKHVAELFTGIDWWRLRPAQGLVATQPGDDDPAHFIAAAATEEGDLAVFYLPVGGVVEIEDGRLDDGLGAVWFDPRDGSTQPAEPTAPGAYTAPTTEDWVLWMR